MNVACSASSERSRVPVYAAATDSLGHLISEIVLSRVDLECLLQSGRSKQADFGSTAANRLSDSQRTLPRLGQDPSARNVRSSPGGRRVGMPPPPRPQRLPVRIHGQVMQVEDARIAAVAAAQLEVRLRRGDRHRVVIGGRGWLRERRHAAIVRKKRHPRAPAVFRRDAPTRTCPAPPRSWRSTNGWRTSPARPGCSAARASSRRPCARRVPRRRRATAATACGRRW